MRSFQPTSHGLGTLHPFEMPKGLSSVGSKLHLVLPTVTRHFDSRLFFHFPSRTPSDGKSSFPRLVTGAKETVAWLPWTVPRSSWPRSSKGPNMHRGTKGRHVLQPYLCGIAERSIFFLFRSCVQQW